MKHIICVGLLLVLGLVYMPVDGQGISLPALSTLPARPLRIDTTISWSEYMKLDLARKTLLGLSFTESDQVITNQQKQLAACEQALNAVVTQSTKTIKQLRDTLQLTRATIQKAGLAAKDMRTTIDQVTTSVATSTASIRKAKWIGWTQKAGAFAVGIVVGVLVPPAINLIKNGI